MITVPKDLPDLRDGRHIARVRSYLVLILGVVLGCSSATVVLPTGPAQHVRGTIATDSRPAGTLYRDEVERAIQVGLGRFLQHVEVRAATRHDDAGRRVFVGFEILALRPAMAWLKFDFAPGDIVTRIDGVSVEHYNNVIPIFEGLAAKDRFEISLTRSGEQKKVVVNIQNRRNATSPVRPSSQVSSARSPR